MTVPVCAIIAGILLAFVIFFKFDLQRDWQLLLLLLLSFLLIAYGVYALLVSHSSIQSIHARTAKGIAFKPRIIGFVPQSLGQNSKNTLARAGSWVRYQIDLVNPIFQWCSASLSFGLAIWFCGIAARSERLRIFLLFGGLAFVVIEVPLAIFYNWLFSSMGM
jgi:hypothetical protein